MIINSNYNKFSKYRVRQRGGSLTHSARTPPAVFRRNWNWEKIIFWNNFFGGGINFFLGGGPYPVFFLRKSSSQIRSPPEFQPLLGEKYVEGNRKPFVRTHYVRTNNAKFNGHYVRQCTHNVRAHAICSDQFRSVYWENCYEENLKLCFGKLQKM